MGTLGGLDGEAVGCAAKFGRSQRTYRWHGRKGQLVDGLESMFEGGRNLDLETGDRRKLVLVSGGPRLRGRGCLCIPGPNVWELPG